MVRSHWVSASAIASAMSQMQTLNWVCNPFSNDVADTDADADAECEQYIS